MKYLETLNWIDKMFIFTYFVVGQIDMLIIKDITGQENWIKIFGVIASSWVGYLLYKVLWK